MATKTTKTKTPTADNLIDLAAFEFALKTVESACGPLPTFFLSTVDTKKGTALQLSGSLNGNEAIYRLPGNVKNLDSPIEVPRDVFGQAVKGRKDGSLQLKDNKLLITSGKYTATVNVSEAQGVPEISEPVAADDYKVNSVTLTPELHGYLTSRLPKIKVERAHQALPDIILDIRTSAKAIYMAAYDTMNSCFLFDTKTKFEGGDALNITVPYSRFSAFIKDVPAVGCKLHTTPDALVAIASQFRLKIALPAVDEDAVVDPDAVYAKGKELRTAKGTVLTIKQGDLLKFLENARALIAVGTEVQFKKSKKGTLLLVESSRGSVKTEVASTGDVEDFGMVYAFVQTLVSKLAKPTKSKNADGEDMDPDVDVTFEVVDNLFCVCRAGVIYAALLSANNADSEDSSEKDE